MAVQNAAPLARSAGSAASRAVTPNPSLLRREQLPKCQKSNVLFNSGGFPSNWQQLGAQQQAEHPINMVMFQLAYGESSLCHCSCLEVAKLRTGRYYKVAYLSLQLLLLCCVIGLEAS
jgi:hypothetical protein